MIKFQKFITCVKNTKLIRSMTEQKGFQTLSKDDLKYVVEISDFESFDFIGKGGFAEVYKGTQKSTGKEVAIKQIFRNKLEGKRFKRYLYEIQTMVKTSNRFLVPLVGFTKEKPYCIITEYMYNGTLEKYIRVGAGKCLLSGSQLTSIAIGISYGLIHLRSLGIIHRDLKSSNILLDQNFLPRICDFGIARFENLEFMTAKVGTPVYMAPEIINGRNYNWKVDVYSLGMLLYEMAENVRPFRGYKVSEIFEYVMHDNFRPTISSHTPKPLRNLIKRCWSSNPDKRPTFEEIFEKFIIGSVEFPGTNRDDINRLLISIERDEKIRKGPTFKYLHDLLLSLRIHESSSYTYSSKDEYVDITLETTNPGTNYDTSNFISSIKSDCSDSFEYSKTIDVIKNQPDNSDYERYINSYIKHVNIDTVGQYFEMVKHHLCSEVKVAGIIISSFNNLLSRGEDYIRVLCSLGLYTLLPVRNKDNADLSIEAFTYLFTNLPDLLEPKHIEPINILTNHNPLKMLILYSYYAKNCREIKDPRVILENLFSQYQFFISQGLGYLFLAIFRYLRVESNILTKEVYKNFCEKIPEFISASDALTIKSTYALLAELLPSVEIRSRTLISHLNDDVLFDYVLSYLLRIKRIKLSKKLLKSLVNRSKKSKKAWLVLYRSTLSKSACRFLLKHTIWANESFLNPESVIKLFILIFSYRSLRSESVAIPCFMRILKTCLTSNNEYIHSAISHILRYGPTTKDFFRFITDNGFLFQYVSATNKIRSQLAYKNCIAVLDHFGRIGYHDSYRSFVTILIGLISNSTYEYRALTCIVTLSRYTEMCELFYNEEVIEFFSKRSIIDRYPKAVKLFRKNMISKL